jgi:glycopeptide antibiotics resistance protein
MQKIIYWTAPFYSVVIVIASLLNNAAPIVNLKHIDKAYHTVAYLIMGLAWYFFFYARFLSKQNLISFGIRAILKNWSPTIAIGASVFSLVIGILIELGQEYISVNRTMDFWDVLANFAGIILAVCILWITDKLYQQHKIK